jgi:hypothetical protein
VGRSVARKKNQDGLSVPLTKGRAGEKTTKGKDLLPLVVARLWRRKKDQRIPTPCTKKERVHRNGTTKHLAWLRMQRGKDWFWSPAQNPSKLSRLWAWSRKIPVGRTTSRRKKPDGEDEAGKLIRPTRSDVGESLPVGCPARPRAVGSAMG